MNIFARIWKSMKDVYDNRIILMALVRRNTAGRYKSSYRGFLWHLLLPVLTIVVLTITFTYIKTRPIENFWIYLSAAIFPVTFMSSSLRGRAIVQNSRYITKSNMPREIVVIASVLTDFISVVFAYMVIIIVILAAGQPVNWAGFGMLPVELALMFIFSLGCSFLISTITVFISDVGYFMSVFMRLVVWITPTFFFAEDAVGLLGIMVWYNPFTYFVEVFHDILYFGVFPHTTYLLLSVILAFGTLLVGSWLFFHYEDRFPEVL